MGLFYKIKSTFLFFAVSGTLMAQDVHYSMFDMAPLNLNPAMTGAYEGTFRIGGIYRDQWTGIGKVNGYRTPSLFIDAPLPFKAFGKNDWFAAGLNIFQDKRGTLSLTETTPSLSLAYHTPLTRSRKVYLALGVQGGFVNNRLDRTGALGQDGILSSTGTGTNDPSLIRDDISSSYPDFGAGILLNFILSQKFNFNLGFSSRHLLEPEDKFTAKNYNRARTFLGNIGFNIDLTRKLTFMPQAMFAYNSSANQLNAQALLGYHLNSARDITFVFGGGVRHHIFGDGTQVETGISAAIARIGLNYKNIKAGLAYDFVTNSLSGAPGRRDAIELAVIYTGKILPKKYLPPRILCPRF